MARFWFIFPILGAKIFVLQKNPALSRTTSYGFLEPCQNLEKTNDTIPRKYPDRWSDRWKDRRTEGWKDKRMDRPYVIGTF